MAVLTACANAQRVDEALKVLQEMVEDGPTPDIACNTTALDACRFRGVSRHSEALGILNRIRRRGLRLDKGA